MRDPSPHLTLIGGPTLLLEIGDLRVLTDPTFDPPGAYTSGPVTLTKSAGPAISPTAVGAIDVVLLSHDQHADNLDGGGRAFLRSAARVLTTTAAARRLPRADGLAPWERRTLADCTGRTWTVTAVPARHGPPGIEPIAGDVTGFVLTDPDGRDLVYVSGDTVWYEGVAEVARRFAPGIVVLFTGAARTRGAFHLTMGANDALEAAHAFPDAVLVPIHNHGWEHFTESGIDLARAFDVLGQGGRLLTLEPGERTAVSPRVFPSPDRAPRSERIQMGDHAS